MTDDLDKLTQPELLELLIDLRGGLPTACSFCGTAFGPENEPVPEEGGDFAGYTCCWSRWEAEEREQRKEEGCTCPACLKAAGMEPEP